ncbi:MAG: hypothetical protein PHI11_11565 [Gallionella sp.]|nr:hypothetical protein [Gallionella sp.]
MFKHSTRGFQVEWVYDPNGNRIQMTDARGYITIYSYDANNHLKTVSKALGAITYNYDALGRTISTVNANNHANTTTLDGVGNVLANANALGFATQYVYDADNRVTRTTDPEGRTTDTTYDNVGRAKTVTTAAGTTSYVYDGDGRMTSSTNPRGITTNYGYDAASRLISLTDANGQITRATYDANGNVLTVTDPNNHVTSYTYDTLNRPLTRTDANGQQWVNTYDPNGNLKTRTVPGGKITTYTYDTLDRISRVDYPDLSVVTYTYDANGNSLSMTDSTGTTSYTYDALNRLASKTDPMGKVVSYSYDGVGNVATLGYPNGQVVRYSYDAGERLVSLTDWLNKTTTYTLNRAGQVTAALFGNNSRADMVYDPAGRMTSLINKKPDGTVISSHALTLDANGNITTSTQQLPLQPSLSNANRAFTYDVANRLATYNGTAVTHDVAGRITSLSGDSYTYNDRDQITSIAGTQIASYAYNGAGHRVMRNLNGAITRFVIDPNRNLPEVLAETDNAGTVQRNYIYGYGLVAQIDSANADHYYHFDPTGSTLALTNATGLVTDSYAYTPYGETTTNGTALNPFRYVGKLGVMDDGNGMQFMRARYYRPDIARFMSLDQLAGSANKPQTLNRYVYATGNPVMGVDPSGLFSDGTLYGPEKNPFGYLGHSDFYRGDMTYLDYTRFDHDLSTHPYNVVTGTKGHFLSREEVLPMYIKAEKACDPRSLELVMHQMQDTYSHYDAGYRYNGMELYFDVAILPIAYWKFCDDAGHLCAGTKPDENYWAWVDAEAATKVLIDRFQAKCGVYLREYGMCMKFSGNREKCSKYLITPSSIGVAKSDSWTFK